MKDLQTVAEQLKHVRAAQRRFLGLWAVEQAIILPGLDRVAADINLVGGHCSSQNRAGPIERGEPMADEGM